MVKFVSLSMKLIYRSPQKLVPSALPQTLLIVSEIYELIAIDLLYPNKRFTESISRILLKFGKGDISA